MSEKEKYSNIRDKLRSLPSIKAHKDFETRLFHRIQQAKQLSYEPRKKRWFELGGFKALDFLKHPLLAPAAALASVVIAGLIVYLAFFTGNQKDLVTEEQPAALREYSATQLETLKSKVENLKTEDRVIAKHEELSDLEIRSFERKAPSDFKYEESPVTNEQRPSVEQPTERTGGPEKIEKKGAPVLEKSEEEADDKSKVIDEIMKNVAPAKESGILESKKDAARDTTKSTDTAKKKKSKKKKTELFPQNPPVEQKIVPDTLNR